MVRGTDAVSVAYGLQVPRPFSLVGPGQVTSDMSEHVRHPLFCFMIHECLELAEGPQIAAAD